MKILKVLFVFIVILAAMFLLISAFIPKNWDVKKNIVINKPIKTVLYEAKRFGGQFCITPFYKSDSSCKPVFFGVLGNIKSGYKWKCANDLGNGKITYTSFNAFSIDYELELDAPNHSIGKGSLVFKDLGDSCAVEWNVVSVSPFHMRIFNLFMSGKISPVYEHGLSLLKKHCETLEDLPKIETVDVLGTEYIGIKGNIAIKKIAPFLASNYSQMNQYLNVEGKETAGPPCGLYFSWDKENNKTEMMAAFPMKLGPSIGLPSDTSGFNGYTIYVYPNYIVTDYYGDYKYLSLAHDALNAWLFDRTKRLKYPIVEQYITDKAIEPDTSKWLTKIYFQY
jgi:effector-binding domain-containing protein